MLIHLNLELCLMRHSSCLQRASCFITCPMKLCLKIMQANSLKMSQFRAIVQLIWLPTTRLLIIIIIRCNLNKSAYILLFDEKSGFPRLLRKIRFHYAALNRRTNLMCKIFNEKHLERSTLFRFGKQSIPST